MTRSSTSRNTVSVRQYALITGNYWAFTLTDGALRMLVVLHFHTLGYAPLDIALLFIFYEVFGVVTNLLGGWLGARIGLNRTMNIGLTLQIIALSMLLVPASSLTVPWVMAAQALSGIAKDLNKLSAKGALKWLVADDAQIRLYRWVALLTGSKNTLKGAGYFLGAALLVGVGFQGAVGLMAAVLSGVLFISLVTLSSGLGQARSRPRFTSILSKSESVNVLSAARLFLFGSRDVWMVVALPVFLSTILNWSHLSVGSFIALWIIGYGLVQTSAPRVIRLHSVAGRQGNVAGKWAMALALVTLGCAWVVQMNWLMDWALIAGVVIIGVVFAVNSSFHSYLIVRYAQRDHVATDVGFYYMANALGRLSGTLLSGWVFQAFGLAACFWVSLGFVVISALLILRLPSDEPTVATGTA